MAVNSKKAKKRAAPATRRGKKAGEKNADPFQGGTITEPRLGKVLDFLRLLWAVNHGLEMRSKQMVAEVGVTGPQRFVLRMVARYPGITAGAIARLLELHPSTLTGVLRRLERQRLLERTTDEHDRRRSLFRVTRAAEALTSNQKGTVEETLRRALGRLDERTVDAAADVLRGVAVELGKDR